ncbi:hypothetical protein [Lysobacter enzymogenes]|uniref:hypothetical protein n=1 Tax=Lysobacter enzymogenes TaxID=69 RepID=UPI001A97A088|nr:hypothetical protein [Lysobacter enzymogenes]QQP97213.1 hypothetical protein JHW38_03965 [Lysobacter enzymogenes]
MTPPHIDLTHEWSDWRQRGRYLVSDDGQRMPVERLRGLLWRDHNELYLKGLRSRRQFEERRRAALKSEGLDRHRPLRFQAGGRCNRRSCAATAAPMQP